METEKKILETFHALADLLEAYFSFGRRIMATASFKIGASGTKEIVTNVDKDVEESCIKSLSSVFPDIPIIAEEHYQKDNILPQREWVFIIDPVDGTAEFARGSDEWSVSLSAIKNLEPRVGILLMPQCNLRFSACKGLGVICNGEVMSPKKHDVRMTRIAVSPRQIHVPEFKARIQRSGFMPVPVSTLTVKIVSILLGKVDAGVYFPQEGKSANIWDYAAAILLLEEFGGKMTSLDGSPMPFNGQKMIHRGGWLATNCSCDHNELLRLLSTMGA